ncbi:MAG: NADPH:quinone oxidoreductase family protein [Alphaproteobacteria bacterium]|jgi:NADPH2:quinone reductase
MRAVLCNEFGEPETLSVGDALEFEPGEGEVQIAIAAAGVNFADILMVAGKYQEKPEFPFSPGLEVAGTVLKCGKGVRSCKKCDRVMAATSKGGFAEQVVVPASDVFRIPKGLSFEDAAGFPVVYGTAYGALDWRANLKAGETLLVLGAAGGVGLTTVEVGKAKGATVIAAANGADRTALAAEHGADHLIDYSTENLRERVREITDGKGVDVIFDPVGGQLFDVALRCLGWEGRLIVIGFASGTIPQVPANILLVKNCGVLGFYWGAYRRRDPERMKAAYKQLFKWFEKDKLKPHVSQTFPLEQAGEAMRILADRKAKGKIVLTTGV